MAQFIELYKRGKFIDQFDLPTHAHGDDGHTFRLIRAVKGGGNGVVFAAEPEGPLRNEIESCAVKLLRQQDDSRIDRFANEQRIMRELDHARIAQLFDAGSILLDKQYSVPWIAMELGEHNLRQHVAERGTLDQTAVVRAGTEMCDALQHLHERGVIHRDVKPDNFVWDGEDHRSLLMVDFGIAKFIGEDVSGRPMDEFTREAEFVGPVFYASPELIAYATNKKQAVDARSDLFQLGKVLWYLATGRVSAGIPSRRHCPFDGRLHEIVIELLKDDPDERLGSAAEVRRRLEQLT